MITYYFRKKLEPSGVAVIFTEHTNTTEIISDLAVNRLLVVPLEGQYQTQIGKTYQNK